MKVTWYKISKITRALLVIGILLVLYGYLSRLLPIYFFWESLYLVWLITLFGLIGLMNFNILKGISTKKNTVGYKIGFGVVCFILLIQIVFLIVIPNSDAFATAKKHIKNREELKQELGEIIGFGLNPSGSISMHSDSEGETGNASLRIIVKGEESYKTVTVYVYKDYGKDWEVFDLE